MSEPPLFFLVAGEASGDLLGARLMAALKKLTGGKVRFAGIGGERMQAEGMELLFPQAELAHFGVFELARHVPRLLRRMTQTVEEVRRLRPAALVTIDAPDFSFRVAKRLKGAGIPLIHYVAPTVWAWRPKRAHAIAQFLDHLLVLLPFEPPYFTREGLDCTFVGHSIVESGADTGNAAAFRLKHQVPDAATILAVLPGSRTSEVNRLLPVFKEAVERLKRTHPQLHIVIPVVRHVAETVRQAVKDWKIPVTLTDGDADKYDAFAAATAALACSGTVSVELAMARLPTVIAYKVSPLTALLSRHFIKVKFVTLINIMRERMIMPEFLQQHCVPEKLAAAVDELLRDPAARGRQTSELAAIGAWLGGGRFVPSEKAAQTVLDVARRKGGGGA